MQYGYVYVAQVAMGANPAQTLKAITEAETDAMLAGKADAGHGHTRAQIADFPASLPASDVYAWAKAPSKPSYTA